MGRNIIEERKSDHGIIRLVSDPAAPSRATACRTHDFSFKERWFVEAQLRFKDEATARVFFTLLDERLKDLDLAP
jgi:hypothetical protein